MCSQRLKEREREGGEREGVNKSTENKQKIEKKEKENEKTSISFQNDFQNSTEFLSQSETIIVPNESITIPKGFST